jgi:hypothetical protein
LTLSKTQIEEGIGREVKSFCFPNGMPEDFRPSQVHQIADARYACSVIAQFGMVQNGCDRYQMPRMGMARKASNLDIGKFLDGVAYYRQRMRPRRRPS